MRYDPDHIAARVEAEEFAGGSMTPPPAGDPYLTKSGCVVITSRTNGTWSAQCTRCGEGCGVTGSPDVDDLDTDALDRDRKMLEDFTAEHRDCKRPLPWGIALPSPATMPPSTPRKPTVWIVKGSNGSDLRVLAERHFTYARPEGEELRFYNGDGDGEHRVATVRPGSWHWVVAETALNPGVDEQ